MGAVPDELASCTQNKHDVSLLDQGGGVLSEAEMGLPKANKWAMGVGTDLTREGRLCAGSRGSAGGETAGPDTVAGKGLGPGRASS